MRWEDYPGYSECVLWNHKATSIEGGKTVKGPEKGDVMTEAEVRVIWGQGPGNAGHL